MSAMAFETVIWLAVLDSSPAEVEVRAFWNVKEYSVLDGVADTDWLWIGETRAVTPEEPRSPGAAGRVFDLLFLRGTTPTYQLPIITEDLIKQVVAAFDSEGSDDLPAVPRSDLVQFLQERRGGYLVPDDREPAS
jgi:hypothetical protein